MKKSILILTIIALCLTMTFALVACNKNTDDDGLQMDTKYSRRTEYGPNDFMIITYTFKSDGTGEFYHYSSSEKYNYKQHFVYEFINKDKSTIMLFRTKLEYLDENQTSPYYQYYWLGKMDVSKNVIVKSETDIVDSQSLSYITYELQQKIEKESGKDIYA